MAASTKNEVIAINENIEFSQKSSESQNNTSDYPKLQGTKYLKQVI